MIAHVVLFRPRPDLTPAARREILDSVRAAATAIPGIVRFTIGRRIRHGLPGYEQAMREDYEFALVVEVEDRDALKAYLTHPAHLELGRHFTESAASALAYDFELADAADAARLLEETR